MLGEKKREIIYIPLLQDPSTAGENHIGIGIRLKSLPKGAKITGYRLDKEGNRLLVEFERR